jgi:hypothetical protein
VLLVLQRSAVVACLLLLFLLLLLLRPWLLLQQLLCTLQPADSITVSAAHFCLAHARHGHGAATAAATLARH